MPKKPNYGESQYLIVPSGPDGWPPRPNTMDSTTVEWRDDHGLGLPVDAGPGDSYANLTPHRYQFTTGFTRIEFGTGEWQSYGPYMVALWSCDKCKTVLTDGKLAGPAECPTCRALATGAREPQ